MNVKKNYSVELEKIMKKPENKGKTLFLHSCCAPCSSYVLEYLRKFFRITVFYFNPNITEDTEYQKRVEEQKRLIEEYNSNLCGPLTADRKEESDPAYPIEIVEGTYRKEAFFEAVKGLEKCGEGSERCFACFRLRLEETVKRAKEAGADYFATTLTISPLKNAAKLNEIGEALGDEYKVAHLPSDFKKKGGYQRSIALSKEYDLYRQEYCGCIFSKMESDERKAAREESLLAQNKL